MERHCSGPSKTQGLSLGSALKPCTVHYFHKSHLSSVIPIPVIPIIIVAKAMNFLALTMPRTNGDVMMSFKTVFPLEICISSLVVVQSFPLQFCVYLCLFHMCVHFNL